MSHDTTNSRRPRSFTSRTPRPGPISLSADVRQLLDRLPRRSTTRFDPDTEPFRKGGQGELVERFDHVLSRRLACKVARAGTDHEDLVDFIREIQITAQLDHPNLPPLYDAFVEPDGRPSFAMRMIEGRTLQSILRELDAVPVPPRTLLDLVDVLIRVCDGLRYAHERGVLHCDVKPSNIMVGPFGEAYLLDWGIARPFGASSRVAATGLGNAESSTVQGSLPYMAPEQAAGRDHEFGPATDVFAIGAILFRITHGRPIRSGKDPTKALVAAVEHETPEIDAHVPPSLAEVMRRALAPRPEARFSSIQDLQSRLIRFSRGMGAFPKLTVPAGATVVEEGAPGDVAYWIRKGTCQVYRGPASSPQVLREMGRGEVFGELAILGDGTRTASVRALTDVQLQVLDRDTIERELGGAQPWLVALLRGLSRRFVELERRTSSAEAVDEARRSAEPGLR